MKRQWISRIKEKEIGEGQCAVWRLGQAGFLIKADGRWLGLDLYLSGHPMRVAPSIVRPGELDFLDVLFGSHDHPDHMDREAWPELFAASRKVKAVVPAPFQEELRRDLGTERVLGIKDGETIQVDGMKFTGIASAHEFPERDKRTGDHLYMGVMIDLDGFLIYHPGDTCMYEGLTEKLRRFGRIDVMILPINGRSGEKLKNGIVGNLTYQEAVDLAGFLKPGTVIPCHYDMFHGNTEDPGKFAGYMGIKYPEQRFWIGEIGECIVFDRKG